MILLRNSSRTLFPLNWYITRTNLFIQSLLPCISLPLCVSEKTIKIPTILFLLLTKNVFQMEVSCAINNRLKNKEKWIFSRQIIAISLLANTPIVFHRLVLQESLYTQVQIVKETLYHSCKKFLVIVTLIFISWLLLMFSLLHCLPQFIILKSFPEYIFKSFSLWTDSKHCLCFLTSARQ